MALTAPTCLTAVALTPTSVRLHWKNGLGATSLSILRQLGTTGPFQLIATLKPAVNSYLDTTVIAATLYTYKVEAVGP